MSTPLSPSSPGDWLAVDSTVATSRWLLGPLFHETTPPSFTSNPDMEPIKVQSEGGLNVTLTIRLLMHGKVQRVVFFLSHYTTPPNHKHSKRLNGKILIFKEETFLFVTVAQLLQVVHACINYVFDT